MTKNYLLLAVCLLTTFAGQAQTIRYVKIDGAGDGSSWTNAAGDIQTMIDASVSGDQVWIASGTYLLTATLKMKEGVNVYGGFFGNETNINNRAKSDLDENGTIEDWEFTNATVLDGQNTRKVLAQANSFETETVWDGVTITKGKNSSSGAGANIITNGKLNNCIVTKNSSDSGGGGICNYGGTVNNCAITQNFSSASGGGIFNYSGGMVNNCTVYSNSINVEYYGRVVHSVSVSGGGIYNYREKKDIPQHLAYRLGMQPAFRNVVAFLRNAGVTYGYNFLPRDIPYRNRVGTYSIDT